MSFPSDPLGTRVEMKINGTWTDVVRYDTDTKIIDSKGLNIQRGQGGLQDKTPTGSCVWTWQDPNGIYNNENPRSPYFGLLPRNTPVRVAVPRSDQALLVVQRYDGARAQTTDKAALDITGDMEIRIDFEPRRFTRWASGDTQHQFLASKYVRTGNQRSWHLRFGDPTADVSAPISFVWSSDGTSSGLNFAECDAPLPVTLGRVALKVTFDVSNGGGVSEVRFYASTTGIDGTYTQVGSTITFGSSIPIFASTANLELGTIEGGALDATVITASSNFIGRIYAFRLYSGIAGSLVAHPDFTGQANGTTSFSDGLGNTWTTHGVAEITDADYRFHGLFSAPTIRPKQTIDGVGHDIAVEAEAGGLIRLITANKAPVASPITLTFGTYEPNGWWKGEDAAGSDTQYATTGVSGGHNAVISDITFAGYDSGIAGSAGVMECGSTAPSFVGYCNFAESTNECHFYGFFKFPSVPAGDVVLFTWYSNFEVAKYELTVNATNYHLRGYDIGGSVLFSTNTIYGAGKEPDNWMAYHSRTKGDGLGNVDVTHEWHAVGTDLYGSGSVANTPSSIGHFTRVVVSGGATLANLKFCHLMTSNQADLAFFSGTPSLNIVNYARGFSGETADARFRRICGLLDIDYVVFGTEDDTELMGPQPIAAPITILYQIPECDGGILLESPDQLALEYRTRKSLNNQPFFELTWAQLAEGLIGAADDTDVANDLTMERDAGGTARAVLEYGPMSVQAPPNGIYRVTDGPGVNNYTVARLPYLTQYLLQRLTWPTSRYPTVKVDLHHPTFTGDTTLQLKAVKTDIGDAIRITDLPNNMAPEELTLLVRGIAENIYAQQRELDWATVPYGPYVVSELMTVTDDQYSEFKAAQHTLAGVVQLQLNADITSSATSIALKTLSGPLLQQGTVNYGIKIDGEFMTATNVSGSSSPQTVTVTRGTVGGYSAAHSANAYVYLVPTLKATL